MQTILRATDEVLLLHAPYGLDDYHTLAAAGALVDCEAQLGRFFRSASKVRTRRLGANVETRKALVAAVEAEGPFDMLLVGSRGLGALKRAAAAAAGHGSVSSYVIAHAPCPVLVVSRSAMLAWIEDAALPGAQQAAAEDEAKQPHAAEPLTPPVKAKSAPVTTEITPQKEE